MLPKADDALFYLRNGEFEKAKQIYSTLLDNEPNYLEWVEGYYVSAFWDNKLDHLLNLREGRDRGKALLSYLNQFEKEIQSRNYPKSHPYHESMQCILEETTRHLTIAYRQEGWTGLEPEVITGLASCHIRLHHFQKALDILNLPESQLKEGTEQKFLKADCYIGLNWIQEGTILYTKAFLEDPLKLPLHTVHWNEVHKAFQKAQQWGLQDSIPYLAIPYILRKNSILPEKIPMTQKEFQNFFNILQKTFQGFHSHQESFQKKIAFRSAFLGEVLLSSIPPHNNPTEISTLKNILKDIRPVVDRYSIEKG